MKTYFLFFVTLIYSSFSNAALPPYYQSRSEIYSLLSHEDVEKKLGPVSSITSISKTDNVYTIKTLNCSLKVYIKYLHSNPPKPGPVSFEFEMGDYSCQK